MFNKEELIYLEYRRNVEAHPFQDTFRHLSKSKIGFRKSRPVRILGDAEMEIQDLDSVIGGVIKRYSVNEDSIAFDFARRIETLVAELNSEFAAYSAP